MLKIELVNTRLYQAEAELMVVPFFSDRIPFKGIVGWIDWLHGGSISRAIMQGGLTGADGDKVVLMGSSKFRAERIMAYGMGEANKALPLTIEGMFTELVGDVQEMGFNGFSAPTVRQDFDSWEYRDLSRSTIKGIYQGYSFLEPSQEEDYEVVLIEESFEHWRILEGVSYEVMVQYRDKVDSEIESKKMGD